MSRIFHTALLLGIACLLQLQQVKAQEADGKRELERAIAAIKNNGDEGPDYQKAGRLLEKLVVKDPANATAWYFFGYAVDQTSLPDGESMTQLQLPLTIRASEAFEKTLALSNDVYTGELLRLDPHTKVLTVWGAQAFAYWYRNKRDSAAWCLNQALQRGGLNRTVLQYFRQVMEECSKGSYLFTNGDMYLYYLAYLQLVEKYRPDLVCVDLNLLNTKWYPAWLVKRGQIPTAYAPADLDKLDRVQWDAQPVTIFRLNRSDTAIRWTLRPTSDKKFLLRSDRILLDILQQNTFVKDVFFAGDVPSYMNLYLDAYLQSRGLTNKLVTRQPPDELLFLAARLRRLRYLPTYPKNYLNNRDNIQVLNNYRFAYTTAADIALNKGNAALANQLLQTADRKYPPTVLPFFADATKQWYDQLKKKIADKASLE